MPTDRLLQIQRRVDFKVKEIFVWAKTCVRGVGFSGIFDNLNKITVIKLNLEPFYDEEGPDRDFQNLIFAGQWFLPRWHSHRRRSKN